jgi:hypothetical protein
LINLQRALLACWSQEAIHIVGARPSGMNSGTHTQNTNHCRCFAYVKFEKP